MLYLRLARPIAQENAKAGNFYRKANDFPRALRLFLQCGDKPQGGASLGCKGLRRTAMELFVSSRTRVSQITGGLNDP